MAIKIGKRIFKCHTYKTVYCGKKCKHLFMRECYEFGEKVDVMVTNDPCRYLRSLKCIEATGDLEEYNKMKWVLKSTVPM